MYKKYSKIRFIFAYGLMKNLSFIIFWILSSIIPSYIFAICIWTWNCNDTFDYSRTEDFQLLMNIWIIKISKQEIEKYWLEQIQAYYWAHENWITTQESVREANLWWKITRAEMAKMISNYAKNILNKTRNESSKCEFIDTESVKWDLATAIIDACKLWIMGQWITKFRPNDSVTRAEFGTLLSRTLWWNKNEWWSTYYENHLKALKSEWIMNKIDTPSDKEIRWYVMLMLMRSSDEDSRITDNTNTDNQISDVIEMLD